MKSLIKIVLILIIITGTKTIIFAQSNTPFNQKNSFIKQLVESKDFIFDANFAYPPSGKERYLDPGYSIQISKDLVISNLPFIGTGGFGDRYTSGEDDIKFTSSDFTYTSNLIKNGIIQVIIKPKNVNTANQIKINISPDGTADVIVFSNYRDRMRVSGAVRQNNN